MTPRCLLAAAVLALLPACSGASCGELPGLRAQRDAARQAYTALVRSGTATPQDTERADTDLHAVERRVYDLEQSCGG